MCLYVCVFEYQGDNECVCACVQCACTEVRCTQKVRLGTIAATTSVSARRVRRELTGATTGEKCLFFGRLFHGVCIPPRWPCS